MKNSTSFYLNFEQNYFKKYDVITCNNQYSLRVIETPHKKWYKQLLQFLSFGIYKAPTQYKCRIFDETEN